MLSLFAQVTSNISHTELLWALGLAIVGGFFSILVVVIPLLISTRRNAMQANDAVNHRHLRKDENGKEPLKAYDAILATAEEVRELNHRIRNIATHVEELLEWRIEFTEKWASLPDSIADGKALAKTLEDFKTRLEEFETKAGPK